LPIADSGVPRLVIAGGTGTPALRKRGTGRAMRVGSSGQIRPVGLPPGTGLNVFLRWRHVHGVMNPAVPGGRDGRGFGFRAVDHPPPLESQSAIDSPAFGPKIAIAEFVLADEFSIEPGPQLGP